MLWKLCVTEAGYYSIILDLEHFYDDSLAGFHVFQTVNTALSLTGPLAMQTSLLPATASVI